MKVNGGAAGVGGQTVHAFVRSWQTTSTDFGISSYMPPAVKRVDFPKDGGVRLLGVPIEADCIAQTTTRQVSSSLSNHCFTTGSYGRILARLFLHYTFGCGYYAITVMCRSNGTPMVRCATVNGLLIRVGPEQPVSPPDTQCLTPGTTLQKLQDLRS